MFRKTVFAIAAVSAVAAAGLTSADALTVKKIGPPVMKPYSDHYNRDHFFFGHSFVFAPLFSGAYDEPCWRKVWVKTSHGLRRRLVDVCAY